MTPQELKNSILQLAIQGKLVEQRMEEGTAEELYKQIQIEKLTIIKDGKMKKGKPLSEITEEEKPFDIPESWIWMRLGDCTSYADKKEKMASEKINPNDWSLDLEDIEKDTGRIISYCRAGNRNITGDKVFFHKGQILYSKLRPYLKKILVAPYDGICTPELVPFNTFGGIDSHYLVTVLKAPHIDYIINSVTYGVKMPRVGTDTMVNLPVPIPPLAEQKRIVAKIEELLPLVDQYEEAYNKLEELNKGFPMDLQKSILQMAIQGKLVTQDPSEGTGEELYKKIQEEKDKLIKAGIIKKDKAYSEIKEDEVPFEIPSNWKWVRLGDAFCVEMGQSPKGEYVSKILEGLEFHQGKVYFGEKFLRESPQKTSKPTKIADPYSVLLCVRAPVGKVNITTRKICMGRGLCSILPVANMDVNFVFYLLVTYENIFIKQATGTTFIAITGEVVKKQPIPLPPLAEQKRIVSKLEEIIPLCEKLGF